MQSMNDMKENRLIPIPEGLEFRLSNLIDELEKEEKRKKRSFFAKIASIAATFLLIGSVAWFFVPEKKLVSEKSQLTAQDLEMMEEAHKALEIVVVKFNKGLTQLEQVNTSVQKADKLLHKNLKF